MFIQTRSFSTAPSDHSSNAIPVVSTVASPTEASAPIDAGSSIRKPISLWPGMYHSPVTNALWEARKSYFERMSSVRSDAPSKSELMTRTPSQSRTSILYKFSSDFILREQYKNPWNEIRMRKLLEDLDALAGTISLKHCSNDDSTTRPLLLVTASVDKMVLKKPISVDTDLKIVGAVTWVGRSSLEIQLEVTQATQDTLIKAIVVAETSDHSDSLALVANFTFVARDSATGKSAPPQQRNIHGRIFGGFLMRRAFELAFATAYAFAGSAPSSLEVDHVDFLKPVDVGNFLRLKSCVLYTELDNPSQPLINVEVVAHVTRPELRSSEVSNKFYFTFSVRSEAMTNRLKIRNVVPATEEEARRVIERKDAENSVCYLEEIMYSGGNVASVYRLNVQGTVRRTLSNLAALAMTFLLSSRHKIAYAYESPKLNQKFK
ncbi:hypothetical protein RJ639_045459 [Escallonia herrerae]|uniref:HotDog ACOT-type domain-containing protein n=1 Tax=Escallonia herrerae TaxID=1293975 RepID=A0AA88W6U0_9ASTE|nr:hypothetical protein RJ639_045459 [Escallonia herrerae]